MNVKYIMLKKWLEIMTDSRTEVRVSYIKRRLKPGSGLSIVEGGDAFYLAKSEKEYPIPYTKFSLCSSMTYVCETSLFFLPLYESTSQEAEEISSC